GRDRTSWFWVFRSRLVSVEEGRPSFLVSESLAVRVLEVVLEPRLLVSCDCRRVVLPMWGRPNQ
ncbi:hypothetical protein LINPERPRIM_LOCUS24002, partial [Linum perenne]